MLTPCYFTKNKVTLWADIETIKMKENRSELLQRAMDSGFSLGIFWCIKYFFFILGLSYAFMNIIYLILTLAVPFVIYFKVWHYKQKLGARISVLHAWQYGVLIFFFGALVVSLEHYLFFRYIAPPDYLANSMAQTLELLHAANIDKSMIETIANTNISPIQMTFQGILNNIFYGVILSFPTAWMVSLRKDPSIPPEIMDKNE